MENTLYRQGNLPMAPKVEGGIPSSQRKNDGNKYAKGFEFAGKQKNTNKRSLEEPGQGKGQPTRQHVAESISGIRLQKPVMSGLVVQERARCSPFIKFDKIQRTHLDVFNGIWMTMGVIGEKSLPKEGAKGSKFRIFTLTDLEGNSLPLFLFGDAYASHGKHSCGTFIMLSNAKARKQEGRLSFSIENHQQLSVVGMARDHGTCKGTRRDGTPCTMTVNLARSEYCKYHAANALKKMKMNIRPQMGGSNFYIQQAKEMAKQERRAMAARAIKKTNVKPLNNSQLLDFTEKYAEAIPNSRGLGALKKVATGSVISAEDFQQSIKRTKVKVTQKAAINLNAGVQVNKEIHESQAMAKAIAFVQSMGGLNIPNPNHTQSIGIACSKTGKRVTACNSSKGKKLDEQKNPVPRKNTKEKENSFLKHFSKTRQQADGASLYEREAEEAQMEHTIGMLNPLMQKEALVDQLASTHKIKAKCYHCKTCKIFSEKKPSTCYARGHIVSQTSVTKRFWECCRCHKRITTLSLSYPDRPCPKCESNDFKKTGMAKAPTVHLTKIASKEGLQARGQEHAKFLKSMR